MTNFTLITGGGSGLGYELAKLFAADGHNLVLVGREAEKLDTAKKELGKLYSIKIETIAADLTNAENIPKIFLEIKENKVKISKYYKK